MNMNCITRRYFLYTYRHIYNKVNVSNFKTNKHKIAKIKCIKRNLITSLPTSKNVYAPYHATTVHILRRSENSKVSYDSTKSKFCRTFGLNYEIFILTSLRLWTQLLRKRSDSGLLT